VKYHVSDCIILFSRVLFCIKYFDKLIKRTLNYPYNIYTCISVLLKKNNPKTCILCTNFSSIMTYLRRFYLQVTDII